MENLTNDQIQLILILFQAQNAERDITDFVPDFHKCDFSFSKYKKIGDLIFDGRSLRAKDDSDVYAWHIIYYYKWGFYVSPVNGDFGTYISFDIMKHISFEDKV